MAMENGPGFQMYFLLKMGIFHCYVSLPEAIMGSAMWMGEFHEIFMKKVLDPFYEVTVESEDK